VTRVLFVCVENANRSVMAEAFARRHGAGRVEAWSAGSRAVAALRERGLELAGQRPRALDELPPGRWDAVVTMGCGDACPRLEAAHREDWALEDPRDLSPERYARVRDEIERRVLGLLARLSAAPSRRPG
jgi:protein-tyrosine-phosphatase